MSDTALREKFSLPLPEAVRRQKAEVEAMMRGTPSAAPDGAPPPPAGGQEGAGPGDTPPVGAEGSGVQATPDGAQQAAPSAPANPPVSEPKAPEKADSKDDIESLKRQLREAEQEARTWKGRHTKTAEEQRAMEARIADLEARLANAKPAEPELKEVSTDEVEAYGQDLLDVAKRYVLPAARAEFEKAMAPLLKRLEALEQGVGQVQATNAKTEWDKFKERLDEAIPGWTEIDVTPEFGAWLDDSDPVYGVPRRNGLDSAVANLDSARVVKVFEAFFDQTKDTRWKSRGTKAARTPAAGTEAPQEPTAQPAQEDNRPTLEELAAPGRPNSSQPTAMVVPPGARIWTQAEITDYYRARQQRSHPHYQNREAAAAWDAEIANAQREGRVR